MGLQGIQQRLNLGEIKPAVRRCWPLLSSAKSIFRDRLFDKTGDCKAAILDEQAFLNMTIGGTGQAGLHTKGNQLPGLCRRSGSAHHVDKSCRTRNMVIRQIKQQQCICWRSPGFFRLWFQKLTHRNTRQGRSAGHRKRYAFK